MKPGDVVRVDLAMVPKNVRNRERCASLHDGRMFLVKDVRLEPGQGRVAHIVSLDEEQHSWGVSVERLEPVGLSFREWTDSLGCVQGEVLVGSTGRGMRYQVPAEALRLLPKGTLAERRLEAIRNALEIAKRL